MSRTTRTVDEQEFWDRIYSDQFPICVKRLRNARGLQGCARDAKEAADEALKSRRESIAADTGSAA